MNRPSLISLAIFCLSTFITFGQFTDPTYLTAAISDGRYSIAFDVDGDGDIDVLSASSSDDLIAWYENDGTGNFGARKIISDYANAVLAIDTADVDLDGDIDVLATYQLDDKVVWFQNMGNGNFSGQIIIDASFNAPSSIKAIDVDGDLDMDVVVGGNQSSPPIVWYENDGTGSFAPPITISSLFFIISGSDLTVADLDGDGDKDLLCASSLADKLVWFQNTGGVFSSEIVLSNTLDSPNSPYVGDLDGDLDLDIICSAFFDSTVVWFENLGGGSFSSDILISNQTYKPFATTIVDIDNDGDNDVVSGSIDDGQVEWFANSGTGVFGPPQYIDSIYNIRYLYFADLTGNNFQDIIAISSGMLQYYSNLGGGTFDPAHEITPSTGGGVFLNSFDFDNDGDRDILATSWSDDKLSYFENLGYGQFGLQEVLLSEMLTNGNPEVVIPGDLDNDGDEELLVTKYWPLPDEIVWLDNLGGGLFGPQQVITDTIDKPSDLALIDVNNDTYLDVIASIKSTDQVVWYANSGAGTFGPPQIITDTLDNPMDIEAGDLDNDGDLDLVATSYNENMVVWYENIGGGFGPEQIIGDSMNLADQSVLVDINNDGLLDVCTRYQYSIVWFQNLGSGSFGPMNIICATNYFPKQLQAVDVNDDGFIDIVAHHVYSSDAVAWFENDGSGNFSTHQTSITCNTFYLDDVDDDGDKDLIIMYGADVIYYKNGLYAPFQAKGRVYYDENQNGVFDGNDQGINLAPVMATPTSCFGFTQANGNYFLNLDTANFMTYYISPDTSSFWTVTSDSSQYQVTTFPGFTFVDSLDFGIYPDTTINAINADLTASWPNCNDTINYWVTVQNTGTTFPSGTIALTLDDSLQYVTATIVPDSIIGQTIYWTYDSLFFNASSQINIHVATPDFNSINDSIESYVYAIIDSSGTILNVATDTLVQIISCAYDPNDKIVTPAGIDSLGYIAPNTPELEYTIRFQNTGTDTAYQVVIKDQLDTNLVWNSLELLASSHNVVVEIDVNGEVSFKFLNINLPDSAANFLESQGFVKFKIGLVQGLEHGTGVYNTANIYFDLNPAVVTNTATNTIYVCHDAIANAISATEYCWEDPVYLDEPLIGGEFTWSLGNVTNSTDSVIVWNADTSGTLSLTLNFQNPICNYDTTFAIVVHDSVQTIITPVSICDGDSVLVFGTYQSVAGSYFDTLTSYLGCDSLLQVELTLNSLPAVVLNSALPDTVCLQSSPVTLSGGSPTGGTYYVDGVQTANFDPNNYVTGPHTIHYQYTDTSSCTAMDSVMINIQDCAGLDNNQMSSLSIFPNPTDGLINIDVPSGVVVSTIVIQDLAGQVLMSAEFTETLDLNLPNGSYLILLDTNQGTLIDRLTIRH